VGKGIVWGKRCGGCWALWPLCMFKCISTVVVEGAYVRDYRGWGCVQLVQ
jgi:hypothetical protein